jgi:hypothetical protein
MRRSALTAAVLLVIALAAITGVASAHDRGLVSPVSEPVAPPTIVVPLIEVLSAAAPEPAAPWAALLLLGGLALAAVSRQRRVVALTLIAVVAVFAFETGLHSTHHLGKPEDAAHCAVAATSAHLSADAVDVVVDVALAPIPEFQVFALAAPVPAERVTAPDAGRAPPTVSV